MLFLCHPDKCSRKKPYNSFVLTLTVVLIFFIIPCISVQNIHAAEWTLAGMFKSEKDEKPVVSFIDDLSQILAVHAGDLVIQLQSATLVLKDGGIGSNRPHNKQCITLKKIVGWVFAPLFYCFNHPMIFLLVLFCLSILFVLFNDFMGMNKKEDLTLLVKPDYDGVELNREGSDRLLTVNDFNRRHGTDSLNGENSRT